MEYYYIQKQEYSILSHTLLSPPNATLYYIVHTIKSTTQYSNVKWYTHFYVHISKKENGSYCCSLICDTLYYSGLGVCWQITIMDVP